MTSYNSPTDQVTCKVWDLPTRVFHWSLVIVVSGAAVTGFIDPEWWLSVHVWFGYSVLALILFRVVWGIIGPRYSRFSSFLFPRDETITFLSDLFRGNPPHYPGHNPAAALMIFALLVTLAGLVLSGLMTLGGIENQGAFAPFVPYWLGEVFEEIHEVLVFLLLILIGGHLLGVIVESLLTSENLAKSMITGIKSVPVANTEQYVNGFRSSLGMVLIGVSTFLVLICVPASAMAPLYFSFPVSVTGTLYEKECGDCHHAFHPSLLPGSSWSWIMNELEDHFGEDASLDKETVASLNHFILENSASYGFSKAANLFREPGTDKPLRITAIPVWKDIHAHIPGDKFLHRKVGNQSNCEGCHQDALQGRFARQNIKLPEV